MAGVLFDVVDETRDVLVRVMVPDAMEAHLMLTARAADGVAMHDALNAFAEDGAALRAAHAYFHIVNGIMHDTSPASRHNVV
jgi:hypothetical protein